MMATAQSLLRPRLSLSLPSAPSKRLTSGFLLLAAMSSTFLDVIPCSSARMVAYTAQRTTSLHSESPALTAGVSGSLLRLLSKITHALGSFEVARLLTSCERSEVTASQRLALN